MTKREKVVNLRDILTLPDHGKWRLALTFVVLALIFLGPPVWTQMGQSSANASLEGRRSELAIRPEMMQVETRLLARSLRDLLLFSCAFPTWQAPRGTSEMFAVPAGLPERATLDAAMSIVAELGAQTRQCALPDTDSTRARVDEAMAALGAVSQEQGFDRGVVLYHRALLHTWMGDYGSAVQELEKLDQRIQKSGVSRRGNSKNALRARGILVASDYMRAFAEFRLSEQGTGSRDAAVQRYRKAIKDAAALLAGLPTGTGPFVQLRPAQHLVNLSTASIWNDLVRVLPSEADGGAGALREAITLRQSPGALREDYALAANIMLLIAADTSGMKLADRRARIENIRSVFGRGSDNRGAPEERLRASIAMVVLGLKPLDERQTTAEPTPMRTAFVGIFQGAATGSDFAPLDVPSSPWLGAQLDQWLFIREWRRLLEVGDVGLFQRSYELLAKTPDIEMSVLAAWRSEAIAQVLVRARSANVPPSVRGDLCALTVQRSDADILGAHLTMARCVYGGWFIPYLLGWGLLIILGVAFLLVLSVYQRTFQPHHHIDRRQFRKRAAGARGRTNATSVQ